MNVRKLPWLRLARKVQAAGLAGAASWGVVVGLNLWVPGLGDLVGPMVEPGIVAAAAFVGGYVTPERPELWTGEG